MIEFIMNRYLIAMKTITVFLKPYACFLTISLILLMLNNYDCLKAGGTDNPDIPLKVPGIIRRHGYISESHTVLTPDGYFITMHRIPFGRKEKKPNRKLRKPIVFIQHGLLCSSADWLITGPKNSIGFLLADQGYDVWLGNFRGNTYAKEHINMTTSDIDFWDFSYDDYVENDLPTSINHILRRTGQTSLSIITHSLGGAAAIAMVALFPEFNQKVNLMICMSPPVFGTHMTSPIRLSYSQPLILQAVTDVIIKMNPALVSGAIKAVDSTVCTVSDKAEKFCENGLFILGGFDKTNLDPTLIPVIVTHFPSITGRRVPQQIGQQVLSGRFSKFDYGKEKNLQVYNSELSPLYPIENVKVPTVIIYADNDWLVNYKDAEDVIEKLPNVLKSFEVPYKNFTHFDFYYGMNTPGLVYSEIFNILQDNLESPPGSYLQKQIKKMLRTLQMSPKGEGQKNNKFE